VTSSLRDFPAAFTIAELLVIIAIVTVLMGLLAPGLSAVRAAGQSTVCRANLRQMAIAAQNYAAVYDAFPPALRFEHTAGSLHQVAWDWVTTLSGELIAPGPLWSSGDKPGEIQQCPAYLGGTNFAGDPHTGYNYNTTYIGGEAPFPMTGWGPVRWGIKPHAARRTATCAIFGDGGYASGANKFMRAPVNTEGWGLSVVYAGAQAFRHRGSTNVAYLDGHIGSPAQPRKGALATESLLEDMDYPRNGFLSDDDRAYNPR
jgi:prepilin-type processing-associated H-X9-DG protein